jgi:hypothetical protein
MYAQNVYLIKIVQLNRSYGTFLHCILQINCIYMHCSFKALNNYHVDVPSHKEMLIVSKDLNTILEVRCLIMFNTKHRDNILFG